MGESKGVCYEDHLSQIITLNVLQFYWSIIPQLQEKRKHENDRGPPPPPMRVIDTCVDGPVPEKRRVLLHIPAVSRCVHPGDLEDLLFLKGEASKNCSHGAPAIVVEASEVPAGKVPHWASTVKSHFPGPASAPAG